MTKKDIERGDLVLLRDSRICVVMEDADDQNKGLVLYGKIDSPFEFIALGKIKHLDSYYNDLTSYSNGLFDDYDIMAVRKSSVNLIRFSVPFIFDALFYSEKFDSLRWDWEREEIKEVTMAEVEEKFGCKVKIVKGEE